MATGWECTTKKEQEHMMVFSMFETVDSHSKVITEKNLRLEEVIKWTTQCFQFFFLCWLYSLEWSATLRIHLPYYQNYEWYVQFSSRKQRSSILFFSIHLKQVWWGIAKNSVSGDKNYLRGAQGIMKHRNKEINLWKMCCVWEGKWWSFSTGWKSEA